MLMRPLPAWKPTSSCRRMCRLPIVWRWKLPARNLTLVDGLISDCGRMVAERKEKEGWFDVSTLKEPFRVEGKKTMGYEVAEQMGWNFPTPSFIRLAAASG